MLSCISAVTSGLRHFVRRGPDAALAPRLRDAFLRFLNRVLQFAVRLVVVRLHFL